MIVCKLCRMKAIDCVCDPCPSCDKWLEENQKVEMVEHPNHYNVGTIEVITFIDDWKMDFNEGNVIKK